MDSPLIFAILFVSTSYVRAESSCICNIHPKLTIEVFDSTHTSIGYIYPNDCAPFINAEKTDEGWVAVLFEQSIAFIKDDDIITQTACPEMSVEDTSFIPSTDVPLPYTYYTSPIVDIGQTMSPQVPATGQTMSPQVPATGQTMSPQVPATGQTMSPQVMGNVALCPPYVVQGAQTNGFLLAQHGRHCYELCNTRASWAHANLLCTQRGGHLVSIHNNKENNYLHTMLTNNYNHQVWIGLNDRDHEEHFQWTTGEKLVYTHWKPTHRKGQHHNHEDCVVILNTGVWDDVGCGGEDAKSEANQTKHAYICEYDLPDTGSFIIG